MNVHVIALQNREEFSTAADYDWDLVEASRHSPRSMFIERSKLQLASPITALPRWLDIATFVRMRVRNDGGLIVTDGAPFVDFPKALDFVRVAKDFLNGSSVPDSAVEYLGPFTVLWEKDRNPDRKCDNEVVLKRLKRLYLQLGQRFIEPEEALLW